MRYLLKYLLFESKNQEIFTLLKNNQGYYNIFDKFHKDGISIQRLSQLIDRIRQDRNIIKVNLLQFKTIEEIDDYLTKVEEDSKYNKIMDQLSNKYNDLLSDKVKSLLYDSRDDIELLKIFFRKVKVYKSSEDFYNSLKTFIANNKGDFNLKTILPKITNKQNIVYKDESLLIVRIENFEDSNKLGSSNWCISRQSSYFTRYTLNASQYFIWDFSEPQHSIRSQIGVTISHSGKISASHFKDDSRCPESYIYDNFADQLNILNLIADQICSNNISNMSIHEILILILGSKRVSDEKKANVLKSKIVLKALGNYAFFVKIYKLGYEIDLKELFKQPIMDSRMDILCFLISENKDILYLSKVIKIKDFRENSITVINHFINHNVKDFDFSISGGDLSLLSKNSSNITPENMDILLDMLISGDYIIPYDLHKNFPEKYLSYKKSIENEHFTKVPVNMMSLIKIETIIKDFKFTNVNITKHYKEALNILSLNKKYQYEILDMFKEQGGIYDSILKNLRQYNDLYRFEYFLDKESIDYMVDNGGRYVGNIEFAEKDYYYGDTFYDDITQFYNRFSSDMYIYGDVIRAASYSEYQKICDEYTNNGETVIDLKFDETNNTYVGFVAPYQMYNTWDRAKKQYYKDLSESIRNNFLNEFNNLFGFYGNDKMIVNPLKIYSIVCLWEVEFDSRIFSEYIISYLVNRNLRILDSHDIGKFEYYLEDEIIQMIKELY
jgi:hypothetical protein